jgi:septal ring factor EnvC (AmiA/AmiB activator)
MHATIKKVITKIQTMKKLANLKKYYNARRTLVIPGVIGVFLLSVATIPHVTANSSNQINQLQEQINQLEGENHEHEHEQGILGIEASSLTEAINKLQAQIDASQARINELQGEVNALQAQITEAETELAKQRKVLGASIKKMYVEGDITTLEMLATSKDLSDFFDKQQYRESVQNKIKTTLDKITALKLELNHKKASVEAVLDEQEALRNQLAGQRSEKNRILSMNQNEQNKLENQIRANSGKLAELRKKQAAAEAALAASLNSGSYRVASVGPVSAGSVVGAIGSTGLSSGPHLHLEVRVGGPVNPGPYIKTKPVSMPPGYISQGYGVYNPLYASGYHRGIDYAAPAGSPIFAIDGGQMYRGCSNQMLGTRSNDYGYVAIVEHPNGAKSVYAHMSGGPAACNYNTYY